MNTLKIYDELKDALGEQAARAIARVIDDLYESELLRLREGFEKLIESHRQSLGRLDRIEQSIGELAEAQKRTEERIGELAEAQKRSEQRLEELAARVDTLAEAQRRTEQRVEELAEAQRKTEERVEELAEAQKRSEQRIEELAEAQRRTEERLEELAARVDTLAEAQRRTEQRVEELAEAQRKTEERLEELTARVDTLAEAQRRTEQRVEELAEAQKKTDQKVEELAEAQRRTEEELRKLAAAQRETRRQLGGLAHTVGYRLEDEAFKALPKLLGRDLGAKLVGRLKRDYIEIAPDRYVEINILGRAVKDSKEFVIIGEAKSQLRKRDVDGFIKRCEGLKRFLGEDQIRVLVVYQAPPQVQRYVREKGIMLYFSYDFS